MSQMSNTQQNTNFLSGLINLTLVLIQNFGSSWKTASVSQACRHHLLSVWRDPRAVSILLLELWQVGTGMRLSHVPLLFWWTKSWWHIHNFLWFISINRVFGAVQNVLLSYPPTHTLLASLCAPAYVYELTLTLVRHFTVSPF